MRWLTDPIVSLLRLAVNLGLLALVLFLGFLALGYFVGNEMDGWEHERIFARVEPLGVEKLLYISEVGDRVALPSANASGIHVFALPASVAAKVSSGGVAYLNELWPDRRWHPTPASYPDWPGTEGEPALLDDVIGRYGMPPPIDAEIQGAIELMLTSEGSYYSIEKATVIVVSPIQNRVAYGYSD